MKKLFVVLAVLALVGGSAFAQLATGTVTANVACSQNLTATAASPSSFWLIQGGSGQAVTMPLIFKGAAGSDYTVAIDAYDDGISPNVLTYTGLTVTGLANLTSGVWSPSGTVGSCVTDDASLDVTISAGTAAPATYTVTLNATLTWFSW